MHACVHTYKLHSMDPYVSQMTTGCGISQESYNAYIQIQSKLLQLLHYCCIADSGISFKVLLLREILNNLIKKIVRN
jgi:hypothetical protein